MRLTLLTVKWGRQLEFLLHMFVEGLNKIFVWLVE
jgi:hypothetical protein